MKRYPVDPLAGRRPVPRPKPSDGMIVVPPGAVIESVISWPGLALDRGLRIEITNIGQNAADLVDLPHRLAPGDTLVLRVPEGDQPRLPLSVRSEGGGTVLRVFVPRVLATEKVVKRDTSGLITGVVERRCWVPPAS